jgi:hypothetical protein
VEIPVRLAEHLAGGRVEHCGVHHSVVMRRRTICMALEKSFRIESKQEAIVTQKIEREIHGPGTSRHLRELLVSDRGEIDFDRPS